MSGNAVSVFFFFSFFCASFKIYLNTLLKKLVLMHLFAVVEGLSSQQRHARAVVVKDTLPPLTLGNKL